MKGTRILVASAIALALTWAPAGAGARSCEPPADLEEALTRTSVAFVGKIVSVDKARTVATVQTLAVWKGPDLPEQLTVVGGFDGADEKRTYNPGATYLFMPSNRQAPFVDDSCSDTRLFSGPALMIPPYLADAVGTDAARAPLGAEEVAVDESSALVPIAIGTVVLLTFVGLVRLYGRTMRVDSRPRSGQPKPMFKPVRRRRREGKVRGYTPSGSRAARKHAKAGR